MKAYVVLEFFTESDPKVCLTYKQALRSAIDQVYFSCKIDKELNRSMLEDVETAQPHEYEGIFFELQNIEGCENICIMESEIELPQRHFILRIWGDVEPQVEFSTNHLHIAQDRLGEFQEENEMEKDLADGLYLLSTNYKQLFV